MRGCMVNSCTWSKLVERIAEKLCLSDMLTPFTKLSMAETFSLLELSTLSILLSALLPIVFDCDNKRLLDERDDSEEIAAPLSIATIAEVPYPKWLPPACDEARESWTPLSCNDGEGCRLCLPPSSSFIILCMAGSNDINSRRERSGHVLVNIL